MAGKLTARGVESMARRKGRYSDGDGLFLRVLNPGHRVYWVYRYRLSDGRDREMSVGTFPNMSLADARTKHLELRKRVTIDKTDPLAKPPPAERRLQTVDRHISQRKRLVRSEAPDLTHLYRHYGFDGKLLYVGVSNNILNCWTSHKRKATWADLVAVITVDHFATREDAEDAEAHAIITERPRFNGHVILNRQERRQRAQPITAPTTEVVS